MPNINDTYASVLAAYSGSVNDKRSARLTEYLGYAKPLSLNDMEKAALAALGHSGSLNDAWDSYLRSLGGSGFTAKADLLSSTFYGNPVPGLFTASEPGVWYDPSSVANLDWRRNLLTFTEQFDNAVWVKTNATVTANTSTSPEQSVTADTITASAGAGYHYVGQRPTIVVGLTYTLSMYVKAGTTRYIGFGDAGDASWHSAYLDTTNGAILNQTNCTATATDVGSGWFRVVSTFTRASAGYVEAYVGGSNATNNTAPIFTAVGTETCIAWGAQLELGSTATAYQRITDVNTEVAERFPNNTLFQDSAGTTPVTGPNQQVGLMLDKSQGLVLGPEKVVNGTFDTAITGWSIANGTATVATGQVTVTVSGATPAYLSQSISTVVGRAYKVTGNIISVTGSPSFYAIRKSDEAAPATNFVDIRASVGSGSGVFVATATTSFIVMQVNNAGSVVVFDNISVKLLAGNHATQATSTQRPIYGINPITGTRNLLTYTEEFDNAAWTKIRSSISANIATAPDGTLTADKLVEDSSNNSHFMSQVLLSVSGNASLAISIYAKAAGRDFLAFVTADSAGGFNSSFFNLSNGTLGTVASGHTASIQSAGSGWYRCIIVQSQSATTGAFTFYPGSAATNGSAAYLGDGTSGIYIWGAQLELGSTATAYQKVVSQYEVTEAGVQSASYLFFDGVDDGMVTPTITPATDKAQVFAGVRKLSDAATAILAEFSADLNSSSGAFYITAPTNASGDFAFLSRGSILPANGAGSGSLLAPTTRLITGISDISADSMALRINGSQVATASGDQGTGNYLAYPLYIGRRGGSSFPFNGRIYSLIVRFGPNLTTGQITATESWVNSKTGAF